MSAQPETASPKPEATSERRPVNLRLVVGTLLHLQVLGAQPGPRVQARILGYLEGQSILALAPGPGLLPTELCLGDEVAVRYLVGRSVYGFASRVIRLSTSPYAYFHLAYPRDVEKVDVRQAERIGVAVAARVQGGSGELAAELRDLSAGGAMVLCPQELGRTGDSVRLSFELTFGDVTRTIATGAVVRNVAPPASGAEGSGFRHGLQFQGLEENDRVFLRGFVLEQLVARGGTGSLLAAPT